MKTITKCSKCKEEFTQEVEHEIKDGNILIPLHRLQAYCLKCLPDICEYNKFQESLD